MHELSPGLENSFTAIKGADAERQRAQAEVLGYFNGLRESGARVRIAGIPAMTTIVRPQQSGGITYFHVRPQITRTESGEKQPWELADTTIVACSEDSVSVGRGENGGSVTFGIDQIQEFEVLQATE